MGNDLKCGQCNECRNDPLLSYMSEETRDNPYPKHSFDSYSRLTRIQREELLRDIEKLYLREFDNAVDRKKNAKPAILQEQETVGDVLKAQLADHQNDNGGEPRDVSELLATIRRHAAGDAA